MDGRKHTIIPHIGAFPGPPREITVGGGVAKKRRMVPLDRKIGPLTNFNEKGPKKNKFHLKIGEDLKKRSSPPKYPDFDKRAPKYVRKSFKTPFICIFLVKI